MNNQTIHSFTIKRRGDNVYDIYMDKKHMSSRGSIEGTLEEFKTIMEENV